MIDMSGKKLDPIKSMINKNTKHLFFEIKHNNYEIYLMYFTAISTLILLLMILLDAVEDREETLKQIERIKFI